MLSDHFCMNIKSLSCRKLALSLPTKSKFFKSYLISKLKRLHLFFAKFVKESRIAFCIIMSLLSNWYWPSAKLLNMYISSPACVAPWIANHKTIRRIWATLLDYYVGFIFFYLQRQIRTNLLLECFDRRELDCNNLLNRAKQASRFESSPQLLVEMPSQT